MLEELSKKDSYWRSVATTICKDRMLADDLVSDMYIKLSECKKEINDFYVIMTIRSIFLDQIKAKKEFVSEIAERNTIDIFEVGDFEMKVIQNLDWFEKGILELSYDHSVREIGKMLNTNYGMIQRTITKAKKKLNGKKRQI